MRDESIRRARIRRSKAYGEMGSRWILTVVVRASFRTGGSGPKAGSKTSRGDGSCEACQDA